MKRRAAFVLASLAFTWLFFAEYLSPLRRVHIPYDLEGYHYPLADYAFQSLRQGHFPHWDWSTYSGMPFAGNVQAALFYPPMWLLFLANSANEHLSYPELADVSIRARVAGSSPLLRVAEAARLRRFSSVGRSAGVRVLRLLLHAIAALRIDRRIRVVPFGFVGRRSSSRTSALPAVVEGIDGRGTVLPGRLSTYVGRIRCCDRCLHGHGRMEAHRSIGSSRAPIVGDFRRRAAARLASEAIHGTRRPLRRRSHGPALLSFPSGARLLSLRPAHTCANESWVWIICTSDFPHWPASRSLWAQGDGARWLRRFVCWPPASRC